MNFSNFSGWSRDYEMSSVGLDVGVMWRLSEDLNVARRFAVRVQHHHHPRTSGMPMIYNGNLSLKMLLNSNFLNTDRLHNKLLFMMW